MKTLTVQLTSINQDCFDESEVQVDLAVFVSRSHWCHHAATVFAVLQYFAKSEKVKALQTGKVRENLNFPDGRFHCCAHRSCQKLGTVHVIRVDTCHQREESEQTTELCIRGFEIQISYPRLHRYPKHERRRKGGSHIVLPTLSSILILYSHIISGSSIVILYSHIVRPTFV